MKTASFSIYFSLHCEKLEIFVGFLVQNSILIIFNSIYHLL